jgi:uncharacterized protein
VSEQLEIHETAEGVRFTVHVQPRASRTEFAGLHGTALKLRVAAPPVDGAANDEVIDAIAAALGVSRRNIRIVGGTRSRRKVVEVAGVSASLVVRLTIWRS